MWFPCANVQKEEPHQKAGTVLEHFHVSREKKKRGKTNLEGGDGGIYRVVWESLQWQEPNEEQFWVLIHSAVSAWVPAWPLLHSSTEHSLHGTQRRVTGGGRGPAQNIVALWDPPRRFQPASSGQGFNIERWLKGGVHPNLKFCPHSERNLGKSPSSAEHICSFTAKHLLQHRPKQQK